MNDLYQEYIVSSFGNSSSFRVNIFAKSKEAASLKASEILPPGQHYISLFSSTKYTKKQAIKNSRVIAIFAED